MRRHLALALLLAGCASARSTPDAPVVQTQIVQSHESSIRLNEGKVAANYTINAEPLKVWAFVPDVYADLGIVGAVLDGRNRVFGNPAVNEQRVGGESVSNFLRCSSQASGPGSINRLRYQFSIATTVVSKDGKTSVETELMGIAKPVDGSSRSTSGCVSTGMLEKKIADALQARARQAS